MASLLLRRSASTAWQRLALTHTPASAQVLCSFSTRSMDNQRLRKLRTHAVNLFEGGDYSDDEDEEAEEQAAAKPFMSKSDRKMIETAKKSDEIYQERKKRWIELSKPVVRVSTIDERGRAYGRGGRKTAQARVWIQPGMGEVVVNRQPFEEYFRRDAHREHVLQPMVATETCGAFDVQCLVKGGGLSGKAGAIRHGLARALQNYNPEYRPPLKYLGFLTRDPRKVERKKIGKVKARKAPQWVRR